MAKKPTISDFKKQVSQIKKETVVIPQEEPKVEPVYSPELKKAIAFREKVKDYIKTDLLRFNLTIRDIAPGEFVLFQGVQSNVWARFSHKEKIFYRTALERNFEKAGLIDFTNDVVVRR